VLQLFYGLDMWIAAGVEFQCKTRLSFRCNNTVRTGSYFKLVKAIAAPYRELRLLPRVQGSRAAGG
jgi:hypothetical protein